MRQPYLKVSIVSRDPYGDGQEFHHYPTISLCVIDEVFPLVQTETSIEEGIHNKGLKLFLSKIHSIAGELGLLVMKEKEYLDWVNGLLEGDLED